MKINKYKEFKTLTEEEVIEQCNGIWEFLQDTHIMLKPEHKPNYRELLHLDVEAVGNIGIELRALKRDGENPMYCNHRIFNFNDTQKQGLLKFLNKLNTKKIPYCLYYSVFFFNTKKLAIGQSGKMAKEWNNRIAKNNSIGTQMLIADFDDITEEEYLVQREKLKTAGLEFSIEVFSGHGFQSIFLLNKISYDKVILEKFTNKLLEKGFLVDRKIKDCARLMRVPWTTNSKELAKEGAVDPNIIETNIYKKTDKRYDLEDVFSKLDILQTVMEIPQQKMKAKKEEKVDKQKTKESVSEFKPNVIEPIDITFDNTVLKELYPMLNIDTLPEAVKSMIMGFRQGYANNMVMFLTLYFKEQGYSKSTIVEVMQILAQQDRFNYPWGVEIVKNEVERFYFNNSYTSKTVFRSELSEFGYIKYKITNDEIVEIDNYVFSKLPKISSTAFNIYLRLLISEKEVFTLDEIVEISGLNRKTVFNHYQDLIKVNLLDKKRAYKKDGEEYKIYLTKFRKHTELGFTKFNIATLKHLLLSSKYKEINNTQLMICMYLKYICYNGKDNCIISQDSLGNALGLVRSTISKSFKGLEARELIARTEVKLDDFRFIYDYRIRY